MVGLVLVIGLIGTAFVGAYHAPYAARLPDGVAQSLSAEIGNGAMNDKAAIGLGTAPAWVPHRSVATEPVARARSRTDNIAGPTLPQPVTALAGLSPATLREPAMAPFSVLPDGSGGSGPTRSNPISVNGTALNRPDTAVSQGFQGLDSSCVYCGYYPPDVQLAAGPTHLVEMVNVAGAIFTKQGQFVSSFSLHAFPFFFPSSDWVGDPKIIYDNTSSRWFATMVDFTFGYFEVAVSSSSDPTASWWYYNVTGVPSGEFSDQPTLGVSSNVVAVGANDYTISGRTFQGGQFWVINKAELVSAALAYWDWWGPSCGILCTYEASIHPVKSLSTTAIQYFASTGSGSTSLFTLYSVSGTPPGSVALSSQSLPIYTLANPPSALQLGSTNTLDSGDGRIMDAVWSNGALWASLVDGCTPAGDTQVRSCFRILEVNTGSPSVSIDQDWASPGIYYLYPALSLDSKGDMTIIVGYSSSSNYPGLIVWGQAYNEPNSLEPGASPGGLFPSGPASYPACSGVCRYGDYFGAATDPDGTNVWVAGEYGAAGTVWSTYIARAQTLPLSVSKTLASHGSTDVGQTVTFSVTAIGGTAGYAYTWSGLPTGCSGGQASVTCVTRTPGFFSVSATVSDGYGTRVTSSTLSFTVYVDPTAAEPVGSPPSGGIDVGQTVLFTTTVAGGSGGYAFTWLGLPGCLSRNLSQLSCMSTAAGAFSVSVSVSDSNGYVATSSILPYLVLSDPTLTAPSFSQIALDVGQVLNGSVTAAGGTGLYSYRWNGLPPGCVGSASSFSCSPTVDGVYNVTVTVTDTNQFSTTSPGSQITVSPRLLVKLVVDTSDFLQGQTTILSAVASGGLAPYVYTWSGLPPGCTTPSRPANNTCTPTQSGTYRVTVIVRDQNGASVNSTMSVIVEPSFFGLLPFAEGWGLVVGVTVLVAVVVFLRVRKRRREVKP